MSDINVDPDEIEKFQALASRWWDSESEFKPLHDINPLRVDYIETHCDGLTDKKILDIGCGGGILCEALVLKGGIVSGIDMADKALKVAKIHLLESKLDVDYQLSTAEDYALEHGASFDVITCLEMLEHVPDPGSVVSAAAKLLKPDGQLFFSTINRNPKSFVLAILGAEYVLNLLPKGTHEYQKFIKPSELASVVRSNQLEVHDITGMTYNLLSKRYKLGKDIDVNYLMHCSFQ
ncbi:MAG: bifunctional 2-polyprenyl-6-hydroxyphenol methylase/3-demethylubiquinol 3-O-methyltransferase UbiG [Proteobacteria bacterium]|nr:bifunctional 2-polyprenyl-6-hydroxyphenol methylase/3-demethylubiquinol 3-O-methyltransferase UbiG [Pseudomonadota bacterium]